MLIFDDTIEFFTPTVTKTVKSVRKPKQKKEEPQAEDSRFLRPVLQLDQYNGEPLRAFSSLYEAADAVRGYPMSLYQCCIGNSSQSFQYRWVFLPADYFNHDSEKPQPVSEKPEPKPAKAKPVPKKRLPTLEKAVLKCSMDGKILQRFNSLSEADRAGFGKANIWACCMGKRRSAGGFRWIYAD